MKSMIRCLALASVLAASSASAAPHWGEFRDDGCVNVTTRQYASILWDIPWGMDWIYACRTTDATINGHFFTGATYCPSTWPFQWGYFDVPDPSCTPQPPQDPPPCPDGQWCCEKNPDGTCHQCVPAGGSCE